MHTFSPAKMWIAGLSALRKPLLHLHTQLHRALPWAEIDMDYMNTHQSAHGDREFGFMQTRMGIARKTVVGHWSDPATLERIGRWSRAACGWHLAQSLRVARFGDNMRDVAVTEGDKVEAQLRLGISVNGFGVGDLVDAIDAVGAGAVDELLADYERATTSPPSCAPAARATTRSWTRRESRRGCARSSRPAASARSPTPSRISTACAAAGDRRAAADGRRLRLRRRGRLEDGGARARSSSVMADGLPGGTSFMEDYTYDLAGERPLVLGSHMLEVCPSIAAGRPRCEIHPLSIGGREDPVRLVFDAAPGPAVVFAMLDLGDRFRLLANEVEVVAPPQPLPKLPVARAVWRPKPDFATAAEAWLMAGGPHHTVFTTALDSEMLDDFAEIAGLELLVIDAQTRIRDFRNELRWNQAYHRLAGGL